MNPLERKVEKLGDSLPMLTRVFEILEMIPVAKRQKKVLTPAEVEARAARRAAKAAAGEPADPDDEDEESDDDADAGENSGAGKRDEERFDISISSEFPLPPWFGKEILDHSADAID